MTERTAAFFMQQGFCSGAAVALSCNNSPETAIVLLALRAAGALVVLLDPRQTLQDALASTERPLPVQAMIAQTEGTRFRIIRICPGSAVQDAFDLLAPSSAAEPCPAVSAHEPAFIIFTSGSTGKSKAVVLTESNLISNLMEAQPFGDYRQTDIALISLPFHHVFGMVLLVGTIVLGYAALFATTTDIPHLLRTIQEHRITRMNGVPALYLAMVHQCEGYDLSSLRVGFVGGAPITPAQYTCIENTLGMTLVQAYGMSECVSISIGSYTDPQEIRCHGSGRFYPRTKWRIVRADGTDAAPGEEGEILVGGPSRMYGYYGTPLAPDAMISTGDLGYMDADGVLHLTGRLKDILIRNGNNLSPVRIEQALLSLPGVRAAVVVSLPDEQQGEVPAAMVVVDGDALPADPPLPKNELPALYAFVRQIPLTASGKPDKVLIREMLLRRRS